jgi:hypothetical protein
MNFHFNIRYIKYTYDDILALYARFGYEEFTRKMCEGMELRYSIKRLSNEAVIGKARKVDGRIHYKLSKFVVDTCIKYKAEHE